MVPEKRIKLYHHDEVNYTPNWLNKDVLALIIRDFRVLEVLRAAGVCKLFYDCCQDNILWYRFLCEQFQVDYATDSVHLSTVPTGYFKKLYKHCFPRSFSLVRSVESLKCRLPLEMPQDATSLHEVNQLLKTHIKASRMLKEALFYSVCRRETQHLHWSKSLVLLDYITSEADCNNGRSCARYITARQAKLLLKPLRFFEILTERIHEESYDNDPNDSDDSLSDPVADFSWERAARMVDFETKSVTTLSLDEDNPLSYPRLKHNQQFDQVVEFLGQQNDRDPLISSLGEFTYPSKADIYNARFMSFDSRCLDHFGIRSEEIGAFPINNMRDIHAYEEKCQILQEILQESSLSPGTVKELYSIVSRMEIHNINARKTELGEDGYNHHSNGTFTLFALTDNDQPVVRHVYIDYQYSIVYGFGLCERVIARMTAYNLSIPLDIDEKPHTISVSFPSKFLEGVLDDLNCKETTEADLTWFLRTIICKKVESEYQGCADRIINDFQQFELPFIQ